MSYKSDRKKSQLGYGGAYKPVAMALSRRVFPELFAQKIVSVQPMTDPRLTPQQAFDIEISDKLDELGFKDEIGENDG